MGAAILDIEVDRKNNFAESQQRPKLKRHKLRYFHHRTSKLRVFLKQYILVFYRQIWKPDSIH